MAAGVGPTIRNQGGGGKAWLHGCCPILTSKTHAQPHPKMRCVDDMAPEFGSETHF